jgi:hypothetical protein
VTSDKLLVLLKNHANLIFYCAGWWLESRAFEQLENASVVDANRTHITLPWATDQESVSFAAAILYIA